MNRVWIGLVLLFAACLGVKAQRIDKPTLTPKDCTEPQKLLVREGITLHDAKKYPDAASKYQQVLAENPDCTLVMYELAMTYYAMGEKIKAMETAYKGSKYKSSDLPLFYQVMANVVDDAGKPDEAIKIYRDALKMLEGDKEMRAHLSSVYYNLGVTLTRQKKYAEARAELKKSVENNFSYASPHYLLSIVYNGGKYKVPAFLAAARFLSLEFNTQRSQAAARVIRDVLKPAAKDSETGNINIFVDFNAPKDEGDFTMYDLLLGTLTTVKSDKEKNKSENEIFVDAIGTVISLIEEDKKIRSSFVGKNYVPFIVALKSRGYAEVFGYFVLYKSGTDSALSWLRTNEAKLNEFIAWSKSYQQ